MALWTLHRLAVNLDEFYVLLGLLALGAHDVFLSLE